MTLVWSRGWTPVISFFIDRSCKMINQTPPYVLAHPMPLFDVPGWSVPSAPLPAHAPSKKRKRHASHVQDDLQSAQENLEKLVQLLGTQETSPSKKQKSGKATSQQANHAKGKPARTKRTGDQPQKPSPKHVDPKKKNRKQKESKDTAIIGKADSRSKPSTSPQEKLELTSLQKHMKDSLGGARFRRGLSHRSPAVVLTPVPQIHQ